MPVEIDGYGAVRSIAVVRKICGTEATPPVPMGRLLSPEEAAMDVQVAGHCIIDGRGEREGIPVVAEPGQAVRIEPRPEAAAKDVAVPNEHVEIAQVGVNVDYSAARQRKACGVKRSFREELLSPAVRLHE